MGIAVNIEPAAGKKIAEAVKIKHKQPTYYNPISTRIQDLDEGPLADPTKYTAAEAATYNLTLDGALAYGAVKTPAVEAVEGVHFTQEEINGAQEGDAAYGKTVEDWKVEPVEAQEAVLYTNEEVDTYNATLEGAVKAGDSKPVEQTEEPADEESKVVKP